MPHRATPLLPLLLVCSAAQLSLTSAEAFNPTVQTKCMDGNLRMMIRTRMPFYGLIYADGHRNDCYMVGVGGLISYIDVPLTAIERCGITYNSADERYFLVLNIREHPMLILDQDRKLNVSCWQQQTSQDVRFSDAASHKQIQLGIYENADKIHSAVFGRPYELRVEMDSDENFVVTKCTGFSGLDTSIQLTDAKGCSVDERLLSNFVYKTGGASAALHSMFRFPNESRVHLQCSIDVCDNCFPVDCARRRDAPFPDGAAQALSAPDRQDGEVASTTIIVEESGVHTDVLEVRSCDYQRQLLSALCVIFGVLLLTSICVNFVLCCLSGRRRQKRHLYTPDQLQPPPPVAIAYPPSAQSPANSRQASSQHSPASQQTNDSCRSKRRLVNDTAQRRPPPPPLPVRSANTALMAYDAI